tara:strand:+ start:25867 stop:26145 length:279 start_codon:yes stop_codon:yes gene_type:complete
MPELLKVIVFGAENRLATHSKYMPESVMGIGNAIVLVVREISKLVGPAQAIFSPLLPVSVSIWNKVGQAKVLAKMRKAGSIKKETLLKVSLP